MEVEKERERESGQERLREREKSEREEQEGNDTYQQFSRTRPIQAGFEAQFAPWFSVSVSVVRQGLSERI